MAVPPARRRSSASAPGSRRATRKKQSVFSQVIGALPRTTKGRSLAIGSVAAVLAAGTFVAQAAVAASTPDAPAVAAPAAPAPQQTYAPKVTLGTPTYVAATPGAKIDFSQLGTLANSVSGLGKQASDSAKAAQDLADQLKASADAKLAELAPPTKVNDPSGAQAYASSQLSNYGWSQDEMQCLVTLWNRESNWTTTAENPSSGAYGIVQSLPGDKMSSIADDWKTNYKTQIKWGLQYVKERYGSPCGALAFHYANNWY